MPIHRTAHVVVLPLLVLGCHRGSEGVPFAGTEPAVEAPPSCVHPDDDPSDPPTVTEPTSETSGANTTPTEGGVEMVGFSFVDEHVAGMPLPYGTDDLAFLADQGIELLVGLRTTALDDADLAPHGLEYLHLPIEDFHAPTLQQQEQFVAAVEAAVREGRLVGVHCTAGLGRTGTMLATWFVANGMGPEEAIHTVRALRPGSIETEDQEQAVLHYARSVR